ncbi:MAG: T9SS type A sorting domain-containing protein [Mameliella sp.]|nr:T9SS type A sorting domain-containing protein [Phaeodactylibacter sp.]
MYWAKRLLFVAFMGCCCFSGHAQTLWTGPMVLFSKSDYTDWTLPENQDSITANISLTRANQQGIFNIKQEPEFDRDTRISPADTEWANGAIADGVENLEFTTWFNSLAGPANEEVGQPKVMHLISEDIYIDVVFTSWTPGGGGSGTGFGGGFAYMRSTAPLSTSIDSAMGQTEEVKVFPNPASSTLRLNAFWSGNPFGIFNVNGEKVGSGVVPSDTSLDVSSLPAGLYFLRLENQ